MGRGVLVGVMVLGLAACNESVTGPTVGLNAEATLAPGETMQVASTAFKLRFEGVSGDSRCPADAVCIQGGDAIVRVTAVAGVTPRVYELHTGTMAPVQHDGFTITMVSLVPYPFSSGPIAPYDYRLTVRITR